MKVTILINNYNYEKFLKECVDSALNQTYQDIEIIIVDDGSTDNSMNLLLDNYSKNDKIKCIQKKNGGQLSVFNYARSLITGEIVCMLDSDDYYKTNYISELVKIYEANKEIDFIFTSLELFYENNSRITHRKYKKNVRVGYSIFSTYYLSEWVGSPTSAISMRKSLYSKLVPFPYEEEWCSRADDCLIWSSSILGAYKFYFDFAGVCYRVHGSNGFFGKKFDKQYQYKRLLSKKKVIDYYCDINRLHIYGKEHQVLPAVLSEYHISGRKNLRLLKKYFKIIRMMKLPFEITIYSLFKLFYIHFIRKK